MAAIGIERLVKRFGTVTALKQLDIEVGTGEFFTLLGPSGCGKTTLLRIVAGFERQDEGDLVIAGRVANDLPAHRRDMGMVFQNYAIFPHMTVFDNVAYGLRQRKVGRSEIAERVAKALALVHLAGFEKRFPEQLSGGQKQRVVLARALVIEPQVLLMDEPLSALDAKVRESLRRDIRLVQQELGITTLYVTHDQEEALVVSDRIMVMEGGEVRQLGTPREIYEDPANIFCAGFIGTSNFLEGRIERRNGSAALAIGGIRVPAGAIAATDGSPVRLAVRPESLAVLPASDTPSGMTGLLGKVELVAYLGARSRLHVRLDAPEVSVEIETASDAPEAALRPGTPVAVGLRPEQCFWFAASGERLR